MPDGRIRVMEAQGQPFTDAAGGTRLAGTSRDVTAERDAERLKDEFFGLISHELRTPLTSIIGYTELLAEIETENLSPQGRRFVEVIERNSRRELSLVGDLLLLTRITAGTFEIEVGRADLGEIASVTVEAARPAATKAGVELVLDAPAGLVAEGDPHRLGQVVENLLSNAIKFTPSGGRVTVAIEPAGHGIALEVADTGIGIAEDDLAPSLRPHVSLRGGRAAPHPGHRARADDREGDRRRARGDDRGPQRARRGNPFSDRAPPDRVEAIDGVSRAARAAGRRRRR